jgi:colicin import membrane protein
MLRIEEEKMARKGVSLEQVSKAKQELRAAGQPVNVRSVRAHLGTGSPNTIQRLLEEIAANDVQLENPIPEPSTTLIEAIKAEFGQIIHMELHETQAELRGVQADLSELARAGEQLEEERDDLAAQLAEMTKERDTLAGQNSQLKADIEQLQERVRTEQAAAETARTELARTVSQNEALSQRTKTQEAEVNRLCATLEEEIRRRVAAEQDAAVQKTRAEGLDDRLNAAKTDIEELKKQSRDNQERANKAIEEAANLRGQVTTLTQQVGSSPAGRGKMLQGDKGNG